MRSLIFSVADGPHGKCIDSPGRCERSNYPRYSGVVGHPERRCNQLCTVACGYFVGDHFSGI